MYLTQVELDVHNRQKMKDLTHAGAYHGWVESCFPEELKNNERSRKLWRLETLGNKTFMLILSEDKPNTDRLQKYNVDDTPIKIMNYQPFLDKIEEGMGMKFKVVINPTVDKVGDDGDKKRMPHVTEEHQRKYFDERMHKKGFETDDYLITEVKPIPVGKRGRQRINFVGVTYEGYLKVTDTQKFKELLTEGFGRKKAYGFGLMTAVPV